jgi:hypothetical protein
MGLSLAGLRRAGYITTMQMNRDERALLAEIGLLGSLVNRTDDARTVLAALPQDAREARIGQALAELTDRRADQAAELLRPLAEGGDVDAQAMRALALHLAGRAAEAARQAIAVPPGDGAAHRLARTFG